MNKILFLTPTLPYPPVSGGVIKSNKVVHFLSEEYELSVACLLKNEDAQHVTEFLTTIKLSNLLQAIFPKSINYYLKVWFRGILQLKKHPIII